MHCGTDNKQDVYDCKPRTFEPHHSLLIGCATQTRSKRPDRSREIFTTKHAYLASAAQDSCNYTAWKLLIYSIPERLLVVGNTHRCSSGGSSREASSQSFMLLRRRHNTAKQEHHQVKDARPPKASQEQFSLQTSKAPH